MSGIPTAISLRIATPRMQLSLSTHIPGPSAPELPPDPRKGAGGVAFCPRGVYTPFALDGRREGGGLRALDKVVNSLRHETLMLPLTLTCARSLRSLAGGVELGLGWSGGGAELEVALAQS